MLKKILEHKITIIVAVVVFVIVVAGAAYFLLAPQKHVLTSTTAQIMTIHETVSADGRVDSDQHVSLAFPKSGRVVTVNVKVGDVVKAGQVLAALDSSQLTASLSGAKADVLSAQANLAALKRGATVPTVNVYNQNISTAKLALSTAVRDSYLKIQDVFSNKISSFFTNNSSANPSITIPTDTFQTTNSINAARVDMSGRLSVWNSLIQLSPTSDKTLSEASNDIAATKKFLDYLSQATNRLTVANSGLSQSSIDAYVSAVNGAATEANAAESQFNAAVQAYKTSGDQLAVVQASSTPEALEIAQATLTKAEANVTSIQSQINDTTLVAPFDGTVASVNPRIGENFSASITAIDMISPGAYKIDIMIPENQIAMVSVGDRASIRFTAYGTDLVATGTVTSIDLSETVTNGVGAYKATVYLNDSNPRIRTDMVANVTVNGRSVSDVIAVPASSIITRSDGFYVLIVKDDYSYTERKVTVGTSDGNWTEITSGLKAGDKVATFGNTGI